MSVFGLHTQGEVDLLVLRAIKAATESTAVKSKEDRVIQFDPFPVGTAKDFFLTMDTLHPRDKALGAVKLVRQISEHYRAQSLPLLKELALVHQMYPEKIVLELEAIKTELADLRRHLCDRDTK